MCRSRNPEMKITRLFSKHLAPSSAIVSGFGALMICFVVNIWIWRWIFWLLFHRNLLLWRGAYGCAGWWVYTAVLLLRRDSCGCTDTTEQLPADSTLVPRVPEGCSEILESHGTVVVVSLLSFHWCCDFDIFTRHQRHLWWARESRETREVLREIIQIHMLCLSLFWIWFPCLNGARISKKYLSRPQFMEAKSEIIMLFPSRRQLEKMKTTNQTAAL